MLLHHRLNVHLLRRNHEIGDIVLAEVDHLPNLNDLVEGRRKVHQRIFTIIVEVECVLRVGLDIGELRIRASRLREEVTAVSRC